MSKIKIVKSWDALPPTTYSDPAPGAQAFSTRALEMNYRTLETRCSTLEAARLTAVSQMHDIERLAKTLAGEMVDVAIALLGTPDATPKEVLDRARALVKAEATVAMVKNKDTILVALQNLTEVLEDCGVSHD